LLTIGLTTRPLLESYAQKLLQFAEDKSKCKIWTRSKHDEIVDLMTKETCKEDKTPASKGLVVKPNFVI
jgi:hypothetical protein